MRKILLGSQLAKYESPRAKQSIWHAGPLLNQARSIIIVIIVVITITKDSLASEDNLLCDPVAIVEEAVVGQGVLEHVDLSRPLERP